MNVEKILGGSANEKAFRQANLLLNIIECFRLPDPLLTLFDFMSRKRGGGFSASFSASETFFSAVSPPAGRRAGTTMR